MVQWTDILDHGDDPGRYTVITSKGIILTCNEDGSVICKRKCYNPFSVIQSLSRERGVRILRLPQQKELLKKINRHIQLIDDSEWEN